MDVAILEILNSCIANWGNGTVRSEIIINALATAFCMLWDTLDVSDLSRRIGGLLKQLPPKRPIQTNHAICIILSRLMALFKLLILCRGTWIPQIMKQGHHYCASFIYAKRNQESAAALNTLYTSFFFAAKENKRQRKLSVCDKLRFLSFILTHPLLFTAGFLKVFRCINVAVLFIHLPQSHTGAYFHVKLYRSSTQHPRDQGSTLLPVWGLIICIFSVWMW